MSIPVDTKYLRLLSSRLRNFKQKNDYIWNFSCPFCGDSQKNKTKARGYIFKKGNGLYYRCHNCGIGTNVAGLVKHVDPTLHGEFVLENYKSGETNNFRTVSQVTTVTTPPKFGKVKKQLTFQHAEWLSDLPKEHFCITYAENRKIPESFYNKLLFTSTYKKFCDKLVPDNDKKLVDDARLIIPFYDENDELIAVSGRALETSDKTLRYITLRTNDSENKLVYGMDRVDLSKTVKIVEGPIDSIFLSNCVASGDANLTICAKNIDAEDKLLIFDNEPRNREIVKMIDLAIDSGHKVVIWPDTLGEKDINDMIRSGLSHNEIESIISNNTFVGLEAKTRFTFWKKV